MRALTCPGPFILFYVCSLKGSLWKANLTTCSPLTLATSLSPGSTAVTWATGQHEVVPAQHPDFTWGTRPLAPAPSVPNEPVLGCHRVFAYAAFCARNVLSGLMLECTLPSHSFIWLALATCRSSFSSQVPSYNLLQHSVLFHLHTYCHL